MERIKLFEEFVASINKKNIESSINMKGDVSIDRFGVYHIKDWNVY